VNPEPLWTFEKWWAGLKNRPITQLKPLFAACWNEAVETCADICGDAEGVDFGMCETLQVKPVEIDPEHRRLRDEDLAARFKTNS
jgi:hypothetical protein